MQTCLRYVSIHSSLMFLLVNSTQRNSLPTTFASESIRGNNGATGVAITSVIGSNNGNTFDPAHSSTLNNLTIDQTSASNATATAPVVSVATLAQQPDRMQAVEPMGLHAELDRGSNAIDEREGEAALAIGVQSEQYELVSIVSVTNLKKRNVAKCDDCNLAACCMYTGGGDDDTFSYCLNCQDR